MKVIKEIQWDMGHRVTNHKSLCRNLHGHRYKAEICIEGDLVKKEGSSDEGMVIDFGDIEAAAMKLIHDKLDHSFMVWSKDKLLVSFFNKNKDLKHIKVDFVPTSENIAAWIFRKLDHFLGDKYKTNLSLHSIKLWETPTSAAVCRRGDVD